MECAHAQCNREKCERERERVKRERKHSLAQIDKKVTCPCNAEGLPVIYDTADGHELSFREVKTTRYVTKKKEQVGRRNPNNSKKTKQNKKKLKSLTKAGHAGRGQKEGKLWDSPGKNLLRHLVGKPF